MKKTISIKELIIQRFISSMVYFAFSFIFWSIIYKKQSLTGFSLQDGFLLIVLFSIFQVTLWLGIEAMYKNIDPINEIFAGKYKIIEAIQIGLFIINGIMVQNVNILNSKYGFYIVIYVISLGIIGVLHCKIVSTYNSLELEYIEQRIRAYKLETTKTEIRETYFLWAYLVIICLLGGYFLYNVYSICAFVILNTFITFKIMYPFYCRIKNKKRMIPAIVISDFGILLIYVLNIFKSNFILLKARSLEEMAMLMIIFYFGLYLDIIPAFLNNRRCEYDWVK